MHGIHATQYFMSNIHNTQYLYLVSIIKWIVFTSGIHRTQFLCLLSTITNNWCNCVTLHHVTQFLCLTSMMHNIIMSGIRETQFKYLITSQLSVLGLSNFYDLINNEIVTLIYLPQSRIEIHATTRLCHVPWPDGAPCYDSPVSMPNLITIGQNMWHAIDKRNNISYTVDKQSNENRSGKRCVEHFCTAT